MRLKTTGRALLATAALFLASTTAKADFQVTVGPVAFGPLTGSTLTQTVSLPSFSSLGISGATLTGVVISITDSLSSTIKIQNISSSTQTFANATASFNLGVSDGTNTVTGSVTSTIASGTANPGTNTYTPTVANGTAASGLLTNNLSFYNTGPSVVLSATSSGGSFSGSETSGSGDLFFGGSGSVSGTVSLTYYYTAVPEPASFVLLGVGGVAGLLGRKVLGRRKPLA
jgi:hypothetical protein